MNKRPHYVKHPGRGAAATAAALGTLAGDAAFERFAHISFANKAPHRHFQHDPGSTSPERTEKAAAVNIRSLYEVSLGPNQLLIFAVRLFSVFARGPTLSLLFLHRRTF